MGIKYLPSPVVEIREGTFAAHFIRHTHPEFCCPGNAKMVSDIVREQQPTNVNRMALATEGIKGVTSKIIKG